MLVIVDRGIDCDSMLAEGTLSGAKVLFLEPEKDAIAQISNYLANLRDREKIDSLHIISHGAPGILYLGNTQLNAENLAAYAPFWQQWRSHFNSLTLEILLYGCQIAKNARGREFVEQLGRLTEANIAASSSLTGNEALQGNWQLEYRTGQITAPLAFRPEILTAYPGILANFTVNAGDISNTGSGTTGGLVWAINQANSNTEDDTITLTASTFTLTAADTTGAINDAFGLTGLPVITSNITIEGNGSTIERSASASENFRLFFIDASSSTAIVTLNNLTLQNGSVTDTNTQSVGDDGGALVNNGGTVTINDSTITNNMAADDGGALANIGIGSSRAIMTINNTTISNNVAAGDGGNDDGGGAIDNDGNSDIGGAGATLTISNSTLTGNTSTTGSGGAIRVRDGATLTIDNNTSITGNSASVGGGGISTVGSIDITLTNTTVSGNSGGNDVETISGTATASNGGGNTIGSSNISVFQSDFSVTRTDTGATISSNDNIDLGSLIVGVSPVVTTFSITNSGGTNLDITSIPSLSGSSLFTIDTSTVTTPLSSGNSTTFNVTFDPSALGSYQTTVAFTVDDSSTQTNFSFTMSATVLDTTTTDPTDPIAPTDILSLDSSTNIFTAGSLGGSNLEVSLQGAALSTLSTIKLLRLDGNNQTTSTLELFSALPNSFRPNGFGISQQTLITETFSSGDRFALELTDLDGSTTSFSPRQLSVSDLGSGAFDLNFTNGLTLQIQQTTTGIPLGVGTNQTGGLEIIDLLSVTGNVQGSFQAYREANFDNVAGLYKIDDVSGTVAGIAPGEAGYARAAIENRASNLSLNPSNQSQIGATIALDGSSLYAPYIIVNSTATGFLSDNPNNSVGSDINAYFLYSAANPDSFDHIVLLGNNTFGFEDLLNGGDRDYNDLIFTVDLTV
ncbi:MAG: DUF4347 domain-containing protein [Cyanobacteria bacterium SBLK]|nr:DUF4347 domain-containing protein [Cyanobacteria bacterium SBLK]